MRTYATVADLIEYAGSDVETTDSPRLLARASELVDSLLVAAVYETDPDGMPLDKQVRDAVKRATCALVEWWGETGDPTGAGGQYVESQIGTVRLKRADTAASEIAPSAVRVLATAGLLAYPPYSPGGSSGRGDDGSAALSSWRTSP
jgi:hypothetical protein